MCGHMRFLKHVHSLRESKLSSLTCHKVQFRGLESKNEPWGSINPLFVVIYSNKILNSYMNHIKFHTSHQDKHTNVIITNQETQSDSCTLGTPEGLGPQSKCFAQLIIKFCLPEIVTFTWFTCLHWMCKQTRPLWPKSCCVYEL